MLKTLICIFVGGGLGSVARYAVQLLVHERITAYSFPWATLSVNIAGSFLIGLFYALSSRSGLTDEMRLFLTAGLCGGFTTFSTFSNDNLALLRQGDVATCMLYIIISVIAGISACFIGGWICDIIRISE